MTLSRSRLTGLLAIAAALLVTTCRDDQGPASQVDGTRQPAPSFVTASGSVTLVGAGNVAACNATGDDATAALLGAIPGTVFTAGDAAYD